MNVKFKNQTIGRYYVHNLFLENNKIKFGSINKLKMGTYGKSGLKIKGDSRGSDLRYYKIGSGPNVFFATFAVHGFEDGWAHDGYELVLIAEQFVDHLVNSNTSSIEKKWTIYIFPEVNPDGVRYGWSNNGPGRHTLYGAGTNDGHSGIDINRCWQIAGTSYTKLYDRYYNGSSSFLAYEAKYLRDFLLDNKSLSGQTVLIDLHGWTTQLIGDRDIGINYYGKQFYASTSEATSKYTSSYGTGYLANWAKSSLGSSRKPARSALIELPSKYNGKAISNHSDVVKAGFANKYINATINLLNKLI